MKYAVNEKMHLCPNVQTKCCTVYDEIKISKIWKNRTLALLSQHNDQSVYFMSQIMNSFYQFGYYDLGDMNLKYIQRKKFLYDQ